MLSDRGGQFKGSQLHGEAEYQYLMRRLGINLIYARKPRTKGKIENQFRFVQRDFVLENLHHTSLDDLNGAGRNGWNGMIGSIGTKGSMGTVPLILREVLALAYCGRARTVVDPRETTQGH